MKPLLKTASPELKELLLRRGRLHRYEEGEQLFAAGDPAGVLPIIVSGRAKMVQFPDAGKEVIIGIFGEGEMFAVPPVIDDRVYPASAYTMEASQILLIPRRDFFEILRDSHEFTIAVLEWLSDMLRQKTSLIQTLAGGSAEQRIAGILVRLLEYDGGAPPVKIKLRREDIAHMAGLTTETTIRAVRRLAEHGDVTIERGKIVITDPSLLKRYLTG